MTGLNRLRDSCRNLSEDERAQATTEYILLLVIVMGFILLVTRKFVMPLMKRLADQGAKKFTTLFDGDFHRFPVR